MDWYQKQPKESKIKWIKTSEGGIWHYTVDAIFQEYPTWVFNIISNLDMLIGGRQSRNRKRLIFFIQEQYTHGYGIYKHWWLTGIQIRFHLMVQFRFIPLSQKQKRPHNWNYQSHLVFKIYWGDNIFFWEHNYFQAHVGR